MNDDTLTHPAREPCQMRSPARSIPAEGRQAGEAPEKLTWVTAVPEKGQSCSHTETRQEKHRAYRKWQENTLTQSRAPEV